MVQAWYMNDSDEDQRLPHHKTPPEYIDLNGLYHLTGVEYIRVNGKDPANDESLLKLKKDRNYSYEDEITCSEKCLPNYHEKLKIFFTEHLHTDEEIRLVLEGSGYFDVRDPNDKWIRISVCSGDLIIIPAGIYHRFTLDDKFWPSQIPQTVNIVNITVSTNPKSVKMKSKAKIIHLWQEPYPDHNLFVISIGNLSNKDPDYKKYKNGKQEKNYIRAKRYFIGEPVWTPHNRPADDMPCRQQYLAKMIKGF